MNRTSVSTRTLTVTGSGNVIAQSGGDMYGYPGR